MDHPPSTRDPSAPETPSIARRPALAGVITGGLWMAFGPRETGAAFKQALTHRDDLDPACRARHVAVLSRAQALGLGAGMLGSCLALLVMLRNAADPNMIGPALAMALITLLYGGALSEFVFAPLRHALLRDTGPAGAGEAEAETSGRAPAALVTFVIVTVAVVVISNL